jgi:eukaryotic translation initiation factor 2C
MIYRPAGTVVENSTSRNDSFIVSQRDLQGCKRPTRYISIVDENSLTADDFHRVTYNLCSTYARATTSVAVIPAIYYADQACERARIHLQDREDGTKFLPAVHANLQWNMV